MTFQRLQCSYFERTLKYSRSAYKSCPLVYVVRKVFHRRQSHEGEYLGNRMVNGFCFQNPSRRRLAIFAWIPD